MKKVPSTVIVILAIATILFSGSVGQQSFTPKEKQPTLKGVSLSPRSFQSSDFTDFFQKAKQAGRVVSWGGDWNQLGATDKGGPQVVTELASAYDYVPVVEAQFFAQSTGQLLRPLDDATKLSYKKGAVEFAEKYKPEYLALGIEVNVLYEKSPTDFDSFVQFYSEVYDAVKAKSPNTKVFTIFQLEKMKGLNGGLFGGKNDLTKAQWFLLDRFPKSDISAFTTYPSLIYKNPTEIPVDYYSEIKSHTTKPIAFTEIGWHSASRPTGWESSDGEQAEFVVTFFNLTRDLNKELVIWSFLYDQNISEPFNSMGLRRSDGTAKPAWDKWVSWNIEYQVNVSSELGTAIGGGSYPSGASVTVSISPTTIPKDLFMNYVFEGWKANEKIVSSSVTYSFTIIEPVSLSASWKTELNYVTVGGIIGGITLVAIIVSFLLRRPKPSAAPMPPPPPPPPV